MYNKFHYRTMAIFFYDPIIYSLIVYQGQKKMKLYKLKKILLELSDIKNKLIKNGYSNGSIQILCLDKDIYKYQNQINKRIRA